MRFKMAEANKARNIKQWLIEHWDKGPDGVQPCTALRFRNQITGGYLGPTNLLRAAKAGNIDLIEIARGRGNRGSTERGNMYQENFKRWAIQHLSDRNFQEGIHEHRELTARELLDAFHALPETDKYEITPHVPDY